MSTIQFKEVNCKDCYKCIRFCPVKAISFREDHAQIINDACILCGECLKSCPQNAKTISSEIENVKSFIDKKFKVYASIAPSFAAAFNIKSEKYLYNIFKKLGFTYAEETAVGAERVTIEYHKLLLKKQMPNIIESSCPAIVNLIEKYYPELVPQIAPVVSPMIAHAKMMKDMYGSRIKVVFIGPCLAKKQEYKDSQNDDIIDAVITFEELEKWVEDRGLNFEIADEIETESFHHLSSRFYPAPGGIIKSLGSTKKYNYKFLKFDGIERCIKILEELKNQDLQGYFFELNSCSGGCLGGACMNSKCGSYLEMRERLINYVSKSVVTDSKCMDYDDRISMKKEYKDRSIMNKIPGDNALREILKKIGKFTIEDELDCGACGYPTCRDKAIAVYNNKASLNMCLPYMRTRAESISNVIMSSTPSAIIALNGELIVQEANFSVRKLLGLNLNEMVNIKISEILDCNDFQTVLETKEDIFDKKYFYSKYNITVEQTILYVKENQLILLIMRDITLDEVKRKQLDKMRSETVEIAQKVIEKQMRVAQEIASLLGETTAETKVALNNLKNSIQTKIGEVI